MGMYINSATGSLGLMRSLYQTSVMQTNILKRLSSGIRINSASDDAAGLSLSEKLKSSINGNTVAKNNAQTGIALLNTADSALSNMTNSLERIRNLAVQAANGVYTSEERQMLQSEVSQMSDDISQSYQSAKFSGKSIFGAKPPSGAVATSTSQITEAEATAKGYNAAHIIHNATEFQSKINADSWGSFVLVNDIDMSALGGLSDSVVANFNGTLDGNNHLINNLNISTSAAGDGIGLIGIIGGTVKNLTINQASLNLANTSNVGILAGYNLGGTIENCSVSGTVTSSAFAGGCFGQIWNGTVENTSANVIMNGSAFLGGITGYIGGATIDNCKSSGSVSGGGAVGGLIGATSNGGGQVISNSSSSSNVSGAAGGVGGLMGSANGSGTISNCFATGNVANGGGINSGGLVGSNDFSISNSYATGNVIASQNSGGFVGANNSGNINGCYSTGKVSGWTTVGGFAGYNGGTITNGFSTGDANGANDTTGGFVGNNSSTISNSFTTGEVNGGSGGFNGGFVGNGTADATNFYKNNMSTDTGNAVNGSSSPLPTSSWDSNVWDIDGDVPELINFASSSVKIQVGSDRDSTSRIKLNLGFDLGPLGFDVSNQTSARQVITDVDSLMTTLNSKRSEVGASTNKLSSVISIQDNRINNLSSSRSNINDADIASESANMVKNQIRQQSGAALLSQMNGLDKNLLMQLIG